MHTLQSFPHRNNSDGSFDSICTMCYATVAWKLRMKGNCHYLNQHTPLRPIKPLSGQYKAVSCGHTGVGKIVKQHRTSSKSKLTHYRSSHRGPGHSTFR